MCFGAKKWVCTGEWSGWMGDTPFRYALLRKNSCSFGHCPNLGSAQFFGTFSISSFLVNKRSLFLLLLMTGWEGEGGGEGRGSPEYVIYDISYNIYIKCIDDVRMGRRRGRSRRGFSYWWPEWQSSFLPFPCPELPNNKAPCPIIKLCPSIIFIIFITSFPTQ